MPSRVDITGFIFREPHKRYWNTSETRADLMHSWICIWYIIRIMSTATAATKGKICLSAWMDSSDPVWECGKLSDTMPGQILGCLYAVRAWMRLSGDGIARTGACTAEELRALVQSIHDAADAFDLDAADEVMKQLETCQIPEEYASYMDELRVYLADVALMEVMELTEQWNAQMEKGE